MAEEQVITTVTQMGDALKQDGRSDWGNKLVVNTGTNPVINFAFMLRVEGVFDLPCKAVKGIRRENEFDYIQEGGLNDYVHLKRKAISKPFTFQVERYVGVNWVDPMPLGTELLLPLILFVNNRTFPTLKPVRNYVFTGCTVIAKDYGELNAEVSGLLVETVTIAYREMVCLDIPNDTLSSDEVWAFDKTNKKKEGVGKRHFNSNFFNTDWESSSYNSKANMEERTKKYDFKAKKNGSAKHTPTKNEHSRTQMEENAKLWPTTKDADGNVITYGRDYGKYVTDYNKQFEEEINNATTPEEKAKAEEKKIAMSTAAARRYEHSKTPDMTKSSAKHKPKASEYSKKEMEKKAKLWPTKDEKGNIATYGRDYGKYVTNYNKQLEEAAKKATDPKEKAEAEGKKIAMSAAAAKRYEHSTTPDMSKSSAKHSPKANEHSKTEMEKNAKKYDIKTKNNGSAKHDPTKNEHTKAEMEKKAKKYDIVANGEGSAKHDPTKSEHSKTEMEKKAKKYDIVANGEGSAKHDPTKNEHTKAEMEKKAKKYDIVANGEGSAKHNSKEKEPSLKDMEAAKQLWPENSSARRKEMTTPVPRLWPTTRSAKQITDFLKKQ